MAHVRQYRPSDFDATAHICRATLPPSLAPHEPARRLAPYVWTHQYTHLSPETCLVLDDGAGRAVGYCIACPSVRAFAAPETYGRYVAEVLDMAAEVPALGDVCPSGHEAEGGREPFSIPAPAGDAANATVVNEAALVQLARDPRCLLLADNKDVLEGGYAATMHVDLLDEWQGKGWGKKLVEGVAARVRASEGHGERGIWIGIAPDNGKVVKFYEKVGFRLWQRKGAKAGDGIMMVMDL